MVTARPNILILAHSDGPPFTDIYNQYAALFDKKHYCVTIAYLKTTQNKAILFNTVAEHVVFFNLPHLKGFKLGAIRKLSRFCREKKFSLVICHRYKASYLMLWVAQFCSIPAIIFVMHAMHTMHTRSRRLCIGLLFRPNMLIAAISQAVQENLRQSLSSLVPERYIITLKNSLDCMTFDTLRCSKSVARTTLGLAEHDFLFGTIGRLVPSKDQISLICAFAKINEHCPKAKLIIIGDGRLKSTLRNHIKALHLEKEIILLGFIPQASRYMSALDCFVLTSLQEAFGMVLLEALYAKIPVIATRVDGITEIIDDSTGFLVHPRCPEELAKCMQSIYEQSPDQREQQRERGHTRVKQLFSSERFFIDFWALPLLHPLRLIHDQ